MVRLLILWFGIRKLAFRVNVDLASLPGPPDILNNSWVQVYSGCIADADISVWPHSVGILILLFFLLLSLCSSRGCQAHDAPHHGRFEPDGQLRGEILADLPVVLNHRCLWFRLQNFGFSAVAVHQGRRRVLQSSSPWSL